MAPELLSEKDYLGEKVDIWAVAILLFEMRSTHPPWFQANPKTDAYYKKFRKNKDSFWLFNET